MISWHLVPYHPSRWNHPCYSLPLNQTRGYRGPLSMVAVTVVIAATVGRGEIKFIVMFMRITIMGFLYLVVSVKWKDDIIVRKILRITPQVCITLLSINRKRKEAPSSSNISAYGTYWITLRRKGSMAPDLFVSTPRWANDENWLRLVLEPATWEEAVVAGELSGDGDGPS